MLTHILHWMHENKIDHLLITIYNEYQMQSDLIQRITGFSGSNAILILSRKQKHIFLTDSRYSLQVHEEVDNKLFDISCEIHNIDKYIKEIDKLHFVQNITPYAMVKRLSKVPCIPVECELLTPNKDNQKIFTYSEKIFWRFLQKKNYRCPPVIIHKEFYT